MKHSNREMSERMRLKAILEGVAAVLHCRETTVAVLWCRSVDSRVETPLVSSWSVIDEVYSVNLHDHCLLYPYSCCKDTIWQLHSRYKIHQGSVILPVRRRPSGSQPQVWLPPSPPTHPSNTHTHTPMIVSSLLAINWCLEGIMLTPSELGPAL